MNQLKEYSCELLSNLVSLTSETMKVSLKAYERRL